MKRVFKISALLFFGVVVSLADTGSFWKKDFSKVIIKEFDLRSNQEVHITNKYGQVDVSTWDQSTVKITVEIVVDARNEKGAEEIYERINISFKDLGNAISAVTEIEDQSFSWNWWGNGTSSDFSINYTVKMPQDHPLQVYNKYGDCSVDGSFQTSRYEIKYGNLSVNDATDRISLQMGYGKAKLESVREADVEIKYSQLQMEDAETMRIESKYSNIRAKDIGTISIESKYDDYQLGRVSSFRNSGKYDDFHIDEVADLEIASSYTDVEIGTLHHFAKSNMRYGELSVDHISSAFRSVVLEGQYTEYVLGTGDLDSFDFDASGDYVDWKWDCKMEYSRKVDEGSHQSLSGYYRSPKSGRSIKAILNYGSLQLR